MNNADICTRLRREFSPSGWALLIYYGIMNVSVSVVAAFDVACRLLMAGSNAQIDQIMDSAVANGWGYIFASLIGALLMLLWKKRRFCLVTIWQKEKPITATTFFAIAVIFVGLQAAAQVFASVMETILNLFGLSAMAALESASTIENTVSMFLYAAIFAPIGEEILFRGLILRSLQKYGKKFAIFGSAFLFGIFHANIIQSPYAFGVGLVLGYVAAEYSIIWAIVLHMFNNMVLADFMTRLSRVLPAGMGDLISLLIIWICAFAAVIILIVKRHEVGEYIRKRKIHPLCMKSFFTSAGIIVLSVLMIGSMLLTFILQQFT